MSVFATTTGSLGLTNNSTGSTTFFTNLNAGFVGTLSSYAQTLLVGTSPITLAVPNGVAQVVYIKNQATLAGTTVTVTWTPTSGASATIINLSPGAYLLLCESDLANGVTAVSVVASALATPIEFMLVG